MIVIDPKLAESDRELLTALCNYLASKHVDAKDVSIGPANVESEKSATFALAYNVASSHIDLANTRVCWPMAGGDVCVETRLAPGIRLLAMLLGEGWNQKVAQISEKAGLRDTLSSLGEMPARHVRDFLDETADLHFVAPNAQGFVYAYSDIRPPVDILSWSDRAAAVAVHLAIGKAEQAADIAAKLARFLPDFDE